MISPSSHSWWVLIELEPKPKVFDFSSYSPQGALILFIITPSPHCNTALMLLFRTVFLGGTHTVG